MAGSKNPKVAAAAMETILAANFAAKVVELNSAYDDGITLVVPTAYHKVPTYQYEGPFDVVIVPGSMLREYMGSERPNGEEILVGLVCSGNKEVGSKTPQEVVNDQIWRYAQAVTEILEANGKLAIGGTPNCDGLYVSDFEPFDVPPIDGTPPGFEQRLLIGITVKTT